jgi:hypothetical protein
MKRLFTLLLVLAFTVGSFSQAPEKMSYQAVIRNSSDQLVTNQSVGMQISILQGSSVGTPVYVETQTPTSNDNGLVSIEIGGGTPVTGTFDGIDWSTGSYFIKTETDPAGGTSYSITGTSQLLSVPYAFYATRAGEHYIGELYGGGVVFWVDQTGSHGLICSMLDLSTSQEWSNIASTFIGVTAQSTWDGLSNSNAIVSQSGHTGSAAKLCLDYINTDYGTGVYNDWYLPAVDQLSLLFYAKYQVQKTLESDGNSSTTALMEGYWTSSEYPDKISEFDGSTYALVFDNSIDMYEIIKPDEIPVRAIRSF